MSLNKIGVVGMAVMGSNLALNIERNNYSVSIFNRSKKRIDTLKKKFPKNKLFPFYSIKSFVNSLKTPRIILLMVASGNPTDEIIKLIIPFLSKGDVLIDGGNSFYKDTIRREKEITQKGFYFLGAGISGGEKGALNGPSIMPGGSIKAYKLVKNIFKKISAKTICGDPCVDYIGPNGSGHYVKMVHNGIEYADMQLISESYFLLKNILQLNNKDLHFIFKKWNKGELNSYLIEITKNIFLKKDVCKKKYLIDIILDIASQKGTGSWASKSALDLQEPLSLITQSVFFRYISKIKNERILASKKLMGPSKKTIILNKKKFIEDIRKSLYLSKIIAYSQGFSQLKSASKKYNWNLNYSKISKIFREGCIIRAKFLENIIIAFKKNNNLLNILLDSYFYEISNKYQSSLRKVVSIAIKLGIPVPAFSSAISYYDSYRSKFLSTNLIQAQRDYFGSHTYKRNDKIGNFHTIWEKN
ncbi:NADP-dependent phosphogluconate dehydrogenase [Buchnera aphidicola]|uniref:NADP-dependent phosphogluconate dehydrogenase n=1 Tax=Buchnera aphidicola TaxID=9 RepID=UPI0030EC0E3F